MTIVPSSRASHWTIFKGFPPLNATKKKSTHRKTNKNMKCKKVKTHSKDNQKISYLRGVKALMLPSYSLKITR